MRDVSHSESDTSSSILKRNFWNICGSSSKKKWGRNVPVSRPLSKKKKGRGAYLFLAFADKEEAMRRLRRVRGEKGEREMTFSEVWKKKGVSILFKGRSLLGQVREGS